MLRKSWIFLILFLFLAACSGKEDSGKENETKLFTTIYPLEYFTEQIAGDTVDVNSLLAPGTDPHTYEPTTQEMVEVAGSDAFIYNGAGLEGYAEKIAEAVKPEDVIILEAAEGLDLKKEIHPEAPEEASYDHENHEEEDQQVEKLLEKEGHHQHGEANPHVWLDPLRAIELSEHIRDVLIELKPENSELYEANFEDLKKRLENLDHEFHQVLQNKEKNEIIVSHDAFSYWEDAYGLRQHAISGLSPTNVPSQKELESIIQLAKEHDLHYVFFEQNVTPKVAEVVRKEIGADPLTLHNLSTLTEEERAEGEDYFSLMEKNLHQLDKAL